jgi:PAS domain S-box-containing protein
MESAATVRDLVQPGEDVGAGETEARHFLRRGKFRDRRNAPVVSTKENANPHCPQCVEHQQQQEGLRRIGHFLSATIDSLAAHIVVLDSTGAIVAANAAWRRFTKENHGDERASGVGINYLAVCQTAAANGVAEASTVALGIRRVLAQQEKEISLTYTCHSPSEERWFTVRVTGFENDGTTWAVVAHEDVTALRRRELAIRQREEWFRSLSASAPIGIFQTDATGRYVYTNPCWREIYGLTLAECQGHGWSQAIHPKDRSSVHAAWEEAAHVGQGFCHEFRIVTPTDVVRWIRVHAKPLSGNAGEVLGYVGTAEDITANKHAEEALRRSEERWQLALQGTNDGIWDWKIQSHVCFLSPRFKEMIGVTEHESVDRFEYWMQRIHPDDVERVQQEIRDHFSKKVPFFTAEYRMRGKGDSYRWVLARGQALWDDAGYAVRMVGSISDISVRKKTEEEKATIAERVMQSNQELQAFASVASHDLQEPLRKIQACGEQLWEDHLRELPEEGREYLQRMLSAADRMQSLISDLLRLSQVTTQARPMVSLDLTHVVYEVVEDLEVRVTQSDGHVDVGALPIIQADASQIRQLFLNLIGNALKFRRHGVNPIVTIAGTLTGEGSWCEIRVTDNGIGFDPKYLARIFMPFQRLHTRQAYEGSGMGLAICRKIVERHNGTITATSIPEQGSTFVITLPVKQVGVGDAQ